MPTVAIDLSVTPSVSTGVGRYLSGLVEGLSDISDHSIDYVLLMGRNQENLLRSCSDRFEVKRGVVSSDNAALNHMWRTFALPVILRRLKIDLLHVPNEKPVWHTAVPTVMTVHDVADFRIPQRSSFARRSARRAFLPPSLRAVNHIIAVSQTTKQDLIEVLGVEAHRISVIGEAASGHFAPRPRLTGRADPVARWNLSKPIVLFVGEVDVRKNVLGLARACEILVRQHKLNMKLVIVGKDGRGVDRLKTWVRETGMQNSVVFTGYVEEEDLVALYQAASVLVLPSLYEGFGLPVIEAMACGTPVIASRAGALPEIVGDAGVLVDATNIHALAESIAALLTDRQLCHRLSQEGLRRSKELSWTTVARDTQNVYCNVLKATKPHHADSVDY